MDSGRVFCLPDMYEVQDRSLADIQYVLSPTFSGARMTVRYRPLPCPALLCRQQAGGRRLTGPGLRG